MRPLLPRNNAGFTLTEVMVAMVIMMVGMVGLLHAIGLALDHNLRNQLREEAVYLGEKYMSELRNVNFDSYPSSYTAVTVPSAIRGGGRDYTVERSVTTISTTDALTKQLMVKVKWTYKNAEYENRVVAPVSKAPS